MKFIIAFFSKNCIGFGVLKPFIKHKFASNIMRPRYDSNGNIYALICDETQASAKE